MNSEDVLHDEKKHSFKEAFKESLRREAEAEKVGRIFEKLEVDVAAMRKERHDAQKIEEKIEEKITSKKPKPSISLCRTKESNPVRFHSTYYAMNIVLFSEMTLVVPSILYISLLSSTF